MTTIAKYHNYRNSTSNYRNTIAIVKISSIVNTSIGNHRIAMQLTIYNTCKHLTKEVSQYQHLIYKRLTHCITSYEQINKPTDNIDNSLTTTPAFPCIHNYTTPTYNNNSHTQLPHITTTPTHNNTHT